VDADKLFLERSKEIEKLVQSNSEFDVLRLSAALRQLLLDSPPLIHEVNRDRRLKVSFEVGDFTIQPNAHTEVLFLEDGVDPETRRSPLLPRREVRLEGFLGHKMLYLKGKPHSVRDVITHGANVAGGVHRTTNPEERHKLIADFSKSISLGGMPGAIRVLQAIGRVTLRGLRPLIEAVERG
jgi:hypothetical protein